MDYFSFPELAKSRVEGLKSSTGATLSFTLLGLLSRGDLLTNVALLLGPWASLQQQQQLDLSWPVTVALILAGTGLNGWAYHSHCKRIEVEYYPQYYAADAKPREDNATWKLQPGLWLSAERHQEEKLWGTFTACWGTFLSLTFFFVGHLRWGLTKFYFDTKATHHHATYMQHTRQYTRQHPRQPSMQHAMNSCEHTGKRWAAVLSFFLRGGLRMDRDLGILDPQILAFEVCLWALS